MNKELYSYIGMWGSLIMANIQAMVGSRFWTLVWMGFTIIHTWSFLRERWKK